MDYMQSKAVMDVVIGNTATCRSCTAVLSVDEEVFCLFEELDTELTLADIIFDLFGFECKLESGYSNLICSSCTDAITRFYNFKSVFLNNQQYLSLSLQESEDIVLNNNEYNTNEVKHKSSETEELIKTDVSEDIKESIGVKHMKDGKRVSKQFLQTDNGWSCKVCHFESPQFETILEHIESHKKFVCEQCGWKFLKKSYLVEHLDKHSDETLYVCPICGKGFKRRTVLVKHKRIHTHPRHYKCDQCGDGFNSSSALSTHIYLKHIGERKHECKICHRKFALRATLQKHLNRHKERGKAYVCQICDMSYMDKSSLKRHVADKHQDKNLV